MRKYFLGATWLALSASVLAQHAKAPFGYRVEELTPLPGYLSSAVYALNDLGDVVGVSTPTSGGFSTMATVWHKGQPTALGRAPRGNYSYAEGINTSGRICGEADDGDIRPLGCVFTNGQATIIDRGGNNSRGIFVSESGVVVGNYAQGFGTTWKPVLWIEDPTHPGRFDQTFLPLFQDPNLVESYNYAYGANNDLQVVGQVSSSLWSARGGFWNNDEAHTLTLLDPLPGQWSAYAYDLNDFGLIVGNSDTGTFGSTPTYWTAQPSFVPQALPLFPGENQGAALKVNNAGDIVGWHGASGKPALWRNGKIYDIQSLLDKSGAGWTITSVSDMNQNGDIVGTGLHFGETRAFVLHPLIFSIFPRP